MGEKSEKRRVLKNTSMTVRLARVSNTIEGPLEVLSIHVFPISNTYISSVFFHVFLNAFFLYPACRYPILILFNGTDVAHIGAA